MKCVESLRYNIKSKGLTLTNDDKKYVEEKIIKKVSRYFDDPSTVMDINIRDINGPKGGIDKEVDIVITIKGDKKPIKITERDMYVREAIDKSSERLEKLLRRYKDKLIKKDRIPRKYYINDQIKEKE